MKNRPYYEKLFEAYPDVVTLPEFREMLGGIGNTTARKLSFGRIQSIRKMSMGELCEIF